VRSTTWEVIKFFTPLHSVVVPHFRLSIETYLWWLHRLW